MSNKNLLYIDPTDLALTLKELGTLGNDVTRKAVIRKALQKAGEPMKAMIEKNAFSAIMDHGEMAGSFRWRSGTKKRGYLSMFIRSMPQYGGNLTKIFEDGTTDRYHKSGWWTGKIEKGVGKTSHTPIETKFIQRGFDAGKDRTASSILMEVRNQVTRVVARSKKLNNGK